MLNEMPRIKTRRSEGKTEDVQKLVKKRLRSLFARHSFALSLLTSVRLSARRPCARPCVHSSIRSFVRPFARASTRPSDVFPARPPVRPSARLSIHAPPPFTWEVESECAVTPNRNITLILERVSSFIEVWKGDASQSFPFKRRRITGKQIVCGIESRMGKYGFLLWKESGNAFKVEYKIQ